MFRFSISEDASANVEEQALAKAGASRDEDFARQLSQQGEAREHERYYRAEGKGRRPNAEGEETTALVGAIGFVKGLFGQPPERVWLEGQAHEVKGTDLRGLRETG